MVKVEVEEDDVVLQLEGAQKFLALKSSLRIPLKKIESLSTEVVNPPWLAGRVGSHLPGVFWAGTFWTREGKIFYYVRDRTRCITFVLRDHDYSKVVVEVEDKQSTARELGKMI